MTILAVKVALDPTPRQERVLRSNVGAARFAFNWGLARIKANLDQREAEKSYGISDNDLTPCVDWNYYGLFRDWATSKNDVAPWWKENSKDSYRTGLERLAKGLKSWTKSRNGMRKGQSVCFPKFRSRSNSPISVSFTSNRSANCTEQNTTIPRCEDNFVILPRIGRVRLHEDPTERIVGAHILRATVKFEHKRWFVSLLISRDVNRPDVTNPDSIIGIDLGIKTLAVLSDGTEFANPKHLEKSLRKIKHLSRTMSRRQGPDKRTNQIASNRYRAASQRLAKQYAKVYYQRQDAIQKMTTEIVRKHGIIVIEDLGVSNMMKNHHVARSIQDASWGEIRRQLEYKTQWNGSNLIVVDRFFPSSKTCSGCGEVRAKLLLSERTYVCTVCGLILDRDLNAALNLEQYGKIELSKIAGSDSEIQNGRGGREVLVSPVKRQPGKVAQATDQTGIAPTQGGVKFE